MPLHKDEITEQILQLVPPGSSEPRDPKILAQLRHLTKALIRSYKAAGRLQTDPFQETWIRQLRLYESEVRERLSGKVILVTGGEGCVGRHLIHKLAEFEVKRIVSIDNARCSTSPGTCLLREYNPPVVLYAADIRDYRIQQQIFETEKPNIVFHLAAQRLPGVAEKRIRETITTDIFGTQNIINLCEEYGVQQSVFSSTGKAARYITSEVYAASKKMAEWLFAEAAQRGMVCFGMVRFTHMLDNSDMCQQFDEKIQQGQPVNIHAPDRYVIGQNVGEAVHLLMNALIFSEPQRLKFLVGRNLGWPTETLEIALYKILQSGRDLPVYFQGIPIGYEESFFPGEADWDNQTEINTLVNALETSYNSRVDSSGEMIVTEMIPFSTAALDEQLATLKALSEDLALPEDILKQWLGKSVREIARSIFSQASPHNILKILWWGVDPKRFRGEIHPAKFQEIIKLLLQSLYNRLTGDVLYASNLTVQNLMAMLAVLATLPSIQNEVTYIQTIVNSLAGRS